MQAPDNKENKIATTLPGKVANGKHAVTNGRLL